MDYYCVTKELIKV